MQGQLFLEIICLLFHSLSSIIQVPLPIRRTAIAPATSFPNSRPNFYWPPGYGSWPVDVKGRNPILWCIKNYATNEKFFPLVYSERRGWMSVAVGRRLVGPPPPLICSTPAISRRWPKQKGTTQSWCVPAAYQLLCCRRSSNNNIASSLFLLPLLSPTIRVMRLGISRPVSKRVLHCATRWSFRPSSLWLYSDWRHLAYCSSSSQTFRLRMTNPFWLLTMHQSKIVANWAKRQWGLKSEKQNWGLLMATRQLSSGNETTRQVSFHLPTKKKTISSKSCNISPSRREHFQSRITVGRRQRKTDRYNTCACWNGRFNRREQSPVLRVRHGIPSASVPFGTRIPRCRFQSAFYRPHPNRLVPGSGGRICLVRGHIVQLGVGVGPATTTARRIEQQQQRGQQ